MQRTTSARNTPLHAFAPNLWIAEGPIAYDFGVPFATRMTVVKLSGGSLWICDPVHASPETLKDVHALGSVKYLVASTWRHVWRLNLGHRLFPQAELWSVRHIPRNCRRLPFSGFLTDPQPMDWMDDFEQLLFKGNALLDEAWFLHKNSRTLIVGDIIQNHAIRGHSLQNTLWKLAGVGGGPNGGVPRDIRWTFTNRDQARQSLDKVLSWDFDKVIIGHGPCVEKNAKAMVKQAFQWMT